MTTQTILGVPFFAGSPDEMIARARLGGLVVAPSGPGLVVDLAKDTAYREAVTTADLALPDSGFMVLAWNLLGWFAGRNGLERLSGLRFLRLLLAEPDVRSPGSSLWVMPSSAERDRNLRWLQSHGFENLSDQDCYVAPDYRGGDYRDERGDLVDEDLARLIQTRRPRWIFLNIGSGSQEPLGHWLRSRLSDRPSIICTGAAIAFLTGGQVAISPWADRFFLGWLFRILHAPRTFLPRYFRALRLVPIMIRWGHRLPPMEERCTG